MPNHGLSDGGLRQWGCEVGRSARVDPDILVRCEPWLTEARWIRPVLWKDQRQSAPAGTVALSDPASLLPQILRSGEPEPPATRLLGPSGQAGSGVFGVPWGGQTGRFPARGGQKAQCNNAPRCAPGLGLVGGGASYSCAVAPHGSRMPPCRGSRADWCHDHVTGALPVLVSPRGGEPGDRGAGRGARTLSR